MKPENKLRCPYQSVLDNKKKYQFDQKTKKEFFIESIITVALIKKGEVFEKTFETTSLSGYSNKDLVVVIDGKKIQLLPFDCTDLTTKSKTYKVKCKPDFDVEINFYSIILKDKQKKNNEN